MEIFSWRTRTGNILGYTRRCCRKTSWQVHAYCLLKNHFHLVGEKNAIIAEPCSGKAQVNATQLLAGELKRRGWKRKDLEGRPKGAAEKIKIARLLRQDTTMAWAWIP